MVMIRLLKPGMPDNFTDFLQESIAEANFSNWGPAVTKLELKSKEFFNFPTLPLALCNATLGLECALRTLVPEGGKVLVPSFTFPATMHSILNAGCEPIVCDVDSDGFVDFESYRISYCIMKDRGNAPYIDAIVLVTSLGKIPSAICIERYQRLADALSIPLIIDAAPALGSRLEHYGDCTVYSMHITKTFGIGEGALVLFKNPAHRGICSSVANFGMEFNWVVRAGTLFSS